MDNEKDHMTPDELRVFVATTDIHDLTKTKLIRERGAKKPVAVLLPFADYIKLQSKAFLERPWQ
jgi:hypothetical protein